MSFHDPDVGDYVSVFASRHWRTTVASQFLSRSLTRSGPGDKFHLSFVVVYQWLSGRPRMAHGRLQMAAEVVRGRAKSSPDDPRSSLDGHSQSRPVWPSS